MMASCGSRIRLNFVDIPQHKKESYWFLVDHNKQPTVYDAQRKITDRFLPGSSENAPLLFLDGALLPSWESSFLLRDGDVITVKTTSNEEPNNVEIKPEEIQDTEQISQTEPSKDILDDTYSKTGGGVDRPTVEKKKKKKKKLKLEKERKETESSRIINSTSTLNEAGDHVIPDSIQQDNTLTGDTIDPNFSLCDKSSSRKRKTLPDDADDEMNVLIEKTEETKNDAKMKKSKVEDQISIPESNIFEEKKKKRHRKRNRKWATPYHPSTSISGTTNITSCMTLENSNEIQKKLFASTPNFVKNKALSKSHNKHMKFDSDSSGEDSRTAEFSDLHENDVISDLQRALLEKKEMLLSVTADKSPIDTGDENLVQSRIDYTISRDTTQTTDKDTGQGIFEGSTESNSLVINPPNISHYDSNVHVEHSSILPVSKLPNGVTVYSRPRRKRNQVLWEMSKEQQLNDVATNRSVILENLGQEKGFPAAYQNGQTETDTCEDKVIVEVQPLFKDYSRFPVLHGPPRIGDKIAYKVLEMSEAYTPEVSGYKEAIITDYDPVTQNVLLNNLFIESLTGRGKFEVTVSDEEGVLTNLANTEENLTLNLKSLLEPRLMS